MSDSTKPQAAPTTRIEFMLCHAAGVPGACDPRIDLFSSVVFGDRSQFHVTSGTPLAVSRDRVEMHRKALDPHFRSGLLVLQTMDGRRVNPTTFEPLRPVAAPSVRPTPRLDSIKNDDNEGKGHRFAELPGGNVQGTTPDAAIAALGASVDDSTGGGPESLDIPRNPMPPSGFSNQRHNKGRR